MLSKEHFSYKIEGSCLTTFISRDLQKILIYLYDKNSLLKVKYKNFTIVCSWVLHFKGSEIFIPGGYEELACKASISGFKHEDVKQIMQIARKYYSKVWIKYNEKINKQ